MVCDFNVGKSWGVRTGIQIYWRVPLKCGAELPTNETRQTLYGVVAVPESKEIQRSPTRRQSQQRPSLPLSNSYCFVHVVQVRHPVNVLLADLINDPSVGPVFGSSSYVV